MCCQIVQILKQLEVKRKEVHSLRMEIIALVKGRQQPETVI